MTSAAHAVLTSSAEPNWRTPGWLRAALVREFDFCLDAAADSATVSLAPHWLGPHSPLGLDDGLSVAWADVAPLLQGVGGRSGAVFCNPPYSRKLHRQGVPGMTIPPWVKAMAEAGQRTTVVGVIPYSPQTRHWLRYVMGYDYRATEIRLFPFRVKFDPPEGYVSGSQDGKISGANVNTAVVIWKPAHEFPRQLPWAPLVRYWVPQELQSGARYHTVVERAEDESLGDDEEGE